MSSDKAIVFIVDDDRCVREALSDLISSAGLRVAAFASATEFVECVLAPTQAFNMSPRRKNVALSVTPQDAQ